MNHGLLGSVFGTETTGSIAFSISPSHHIVAIVCRFLELDQSVEGLGGAGAGVRVDLVQSLFHSLESGSWQRFDIGVLLLAERRPESSDFA